MNHLKYAPWSTWLICFLVVDIKELFGRSRAAVSMVLSECRDHSFHFGPLPSLERVAHCQAELQKCLIIFNSFTLIDNIPSTYQQKMSSIKRERVDENQRPNVIKIEEDDEVVVTHTRRYINTSLTIVAALCDTMGTALTHFSLRAGRREPLSTSPALKKDSETAQTLKRPQPLHDGNSESAENLAKRLKTAEQALASLQAEMNSLKQEKAKQAQQVQQVQQIQSAQPAQNAQPVQQPGIQPWSVQELMHIQSLTTIICSYKGNVDVVDHLRDNAWRAMVQSCIEEILRVRHDMRITGDSGNKGGLREPLFSGVCDSLKGRIKQNKGIIDHNMVQGFMDKVGYSIQEEKRRRKSEAEEERRKAIEATKQAIQKAAQAPRLSLQPHSMQRQTNCTTAAQPQQYPQNTTQTSAQILAQQNVSSNTARQSTQVSQHATQAFPSRSIQNGMQQGVYFNTTQRPPQSLQYTAQALSPALQQKAANYQIPAATLSDLSRAQPALSSGTWSPHVRYWRSGIPPTLLSSSAVYGTSTALQPATKAAQKDYIPVKPTLPANNERVASWLSDIEQPVEGEQVKHGAAQSSHPAAAQNTVNQRNGGPELMGFASYVPRPRTLPDRAQPIGERDPMAPVLVEHIRRVQMILPKVAVRDIKHALMSSRHVLDDAIAMLCSQPTKASLAAVHQPAPTLRSVNHAIEQPAGEEKGGHWLRPRKVAAEPTPRKRQASVEL